MLAPAGSVRVGAVQVEVEAGQPARLSAIGPPPWVVTWQGADETVTVLEVPGPLLDLTRLLQPAPVRGSLITLDIRPSPAARAVVLVAGDQVLVAEPTAEGFLGRAPRGVPTEIIALFGDERPVSLGRRYVPDPARTPQPLAVGPDVPLSEGTAVRLESAPAGHVQGELTVGGLRTGLILGSGLAARQEAVVLPRPAAAAWPEAGLWIEAQARDPGQALPYATTAAHLRLETTEATLVWPADGQVRPAPGPTHAAPVLADGRLRWLAGEALWVEVVLDAIDGCAPPRRWRILAPAAPESLVLPALEFLQWPLLQARVGLRTRADTTWAELLAGEAPLPVRWPQTLSLVSERWVAGALRGGDACTASPRQGRYLLEEPRCREDVSRAVVVDRCGRLLPEDGGVDFCAATADDLVPTDDGFALGSARLVAPAVASQAAPGGLQGDYHRIEIRRQHRRATASGAPDVPLEAVVRIESGDAATGPFARISPEGRVTVRAERFDFDGALADFDGLVGTLTPDACGEPLPFSFDGALRITRWRLTGPGVGEELQVVLQRR